MKSRSETGRMRDPSSGTLLSAVRLGYFLSLSLMYLSIKSSASAPVHAYIVGCMALFAAVHFRYPAAAGKRQRAAVALIDIAITTSYAYVFLNEESPDLLFMGLSSLYLFMYAQSRLVTALWYSFFAADLLALALIQWHKYGTIEGAYYIVNGSFVVFAGLVGSLIRYYKQSRLQTVRLNEELEASNRRLSEYALQVEELAANRERVRIAREIHDTVGHNLTALLIQLEAARKLRAIDAARSDESLLQCEELVRSALREVRLSVRTIREEDIGLPATESVRRLAGQFSDLTGMRIAVEADRGFPAVPDAMRLTLIRIVQESLTNALKHGGASEARVTMRASESDIDVRIVDNGKGAAAYTPGFGLINMRERAEEHGGTLQSTASPEGGFEVKVILPSAGTRRREIG